MSLFGSRIPDCESSEAADSIPTSVTGASFSLGEVTDPFTSTEYAPLRTIGNPSFGASIPCSALSGPLLDQPLRFTQSPPDRLYPPPDPPAHIHTSGSSSAFPFFLRSVILFIFLFFALMICDGYRDSLELLHAARPAWP